MNKSKLLATAFVVASLSFSSAQAKSMCSFNSKGEMVASYKTSGCDKHETTNRNQIKNMQKRVINLNKVYFVQKSKLDNITSDTNALTDRRSRSSSEKEKANIDVAIKNNKYKYNTAASTLNVAIAEISDLSKNIVKFTKDSHEILRVTQYNIHSKVDLI